MSNNRFFTAPSVDVRPDMTTQTRKPGSWPGVVPQVRLELTLDGF